MRRMMTLLIGTIGMSAVGCASNRPVPPSPMASAGSSAERVRLDQLHEMALKDAQPKR